MIVKKIKKGGHGHHGGAWKVAYADFVTAMMAFFIVMWILASAEEIKQSVSDYFNAPENYSVFTGKLTSPVTIFDNPAINTGNSGDGTTDYQFLNFSSTNSTDTIQMSETTIKAIKDSIAAAHIVEDIATQIRNEIEEQLREAVSLEMKNILNSIHIEITPDGLRIELLESYDNNFFEIGSARLKPDAVEILKQLARQIGQLPNLVEIEGHTDSRGYASGAVYGNWELSADRANSARKILESNGFYPGQILSVSGFADKKLRTPDNPFDVSNRRVSILVKNLSRASFYSSGAFY